MSWRHDTHTSVVRTARKEHACCECGEAILPLAAYRYSSGVYDGRPYDHKQCTACYKLFVAAENAARISDEGPCFGELCGWFVAYQRHGETRDAWVESMAALIGRPEAELERLFKANGA